MAKKPITLRIVGDGDNRPSRTIEGFYEVQKLSKTKVRFVFTIVTQEFKDTYGIVAVYLEKGVWKYNVDSQIEFAFVKALQALGS